MQRLWVTVAIFLFLITSAYAQVTNVWEKNVGDFTWFTTANTTRGMGYNPVTDHLLVCSREGGTNVYLLNAATGDSVGQLDMTGVSGGTFSLNIAKGADDGAIYGCNLSLANGEFKVYRWADETSAPTVAYAAIVTSRAGDAFEVSGSGVNTVIFASGSGSTEILRLVTTDGITFAPANGVPVAAGLARGGISVIPESNAGELWVNGSGTAVSHVDTAGTVINQVATTTIASGFFNVRYLPGDAAKLLAVAGSAGATDLQKIHFYDITTNETEPPLYAIDSLTNAPNSNGNATADLAYKDNGDGTLTVYVMITNNGIAAYTVEMPQEFVPNLVINEINYNPIESGTDTTEFIELLNMEAAAVDLSGYAFSAGVDFTFPSGAMVGANEYLVVAFDSAAFHNTYGFAPDFVWTSGALSNGGEAVAIATSMGTLVDSVNFDDIAPWPTEPDGFGPTLELIDPASDNNLAENWQASYIDGGTPKAENSLPPAGPVATIWEKGVADFSWLTTANTTRGMGYNAATNHLLVVSREGGTNVYILDAATGDSLGALDMTGVAGGIFTLNIVKVADDGAIYGCNLALASGQFKMYRWADESAVPTLAFDGIVPNRSGDSFGVTGAGNGTILYASGSGSTEVTRFTTTDGLNFVLDTPIAVAGGLARGGISPIPSGLFERVSTEELWVNGSGTATSHIDGSGTVINAVNTGVVSSSWFNVQYMMGGDRKYIAITGNNSADNGPKVQVWDITDSETDPTFLGEGALSFAYNTNANATADLGFRNNGDTTLTVFQLITNNGIAAYTVDIPDPVVIPMVSLAQIQTTPDGNEGPSPYAGQIVQTSGTVTGKNANGFFLQDAPGAWNGVWVFSPTFADTAQIGDNLTITGLVDEFNDLTEMLNLSEYVVNTTGNPLPDPEMVSTADFSQEKYEGVLIHVSEAEVTNPDLGFGEWEVNDGSGPAIVDDFIFQFAPDSGAVYNITGIGNYSFGAFKMVPRDSADIELFVADPITQNWEKGVGDFSWLTTANTTRGMGYNPVTDHLLVVSREGGTNVYVLDAATGDSLSSLDMTGVSGGIFLLNIAKAAADGAIYACNLALANGEFKVYRWADESAVPTVAFTGIVTGRSGDAMGVYGSGANTVIYASGSGSTEIVRLTTTDGVNFTADTPISVAAGLARGGISAIPESMGSELWVNGTGTAVSHIDVNGNVIAQTNGGVVASSWFSVNYFAGGGSKFIAVAANPGADLGNKIQVYDITDSETDPALYATGELSFAFNGNANATGDLAYRMNNDGTVTLFQLVTNNGIASYDVELPGGAIGVPVFSTNELNFGEVPLGGLETLSFSIENQGAADVQILSATLSDTLSFSSTLLGNELIQPDSTLLVTVAFAPAAAGTFADSLVVTTNYGTFSVALNGSAYELYPLDWRVLADSTDWFGTNNLVRTIAYSQATNHLYVVSRVGGNFVKVLDAETGELVKDLDMTGFTGTGLIHLNMAAATTDGVIYAANLAQGGDFVLYRWENEDAMLTTAFSGILDGRVGDVISVSGHDHGTEIYVSGSGNANAFVLGTADGVTFSVTDTIPLPEADAARFGLSPVMDGEYFFINAPGKAPRYIKRSGEVVYTFDTGLVSGTSISYFEIFTTDSETRRFVAALDGFSPGMRIVELLGEPGDSLMTDFAVLPANTPKYLTNANGNASAQAVFNPVNNSLVEMVTNNGISSYSFDVIVPNDSLLVGIDSDLDAIPQAYALGQNYPNPFNPTTTFVVSLPQVSDVKVMIYNVLGQQVAVLQNGKMQAGEHKFTFDASRFASGMYFYRVEANNFRAVKKMLLVK